jgi:hypothetical protein
MQRSMFLPSGYLVKNNASVQFSEFLDLNDLILGKPSIKASEPKETPKTSECPEENNYLEWMEDEMSNYLVPLSSIQKQKIVNSLKAESVPLLELVEDTLHDTTLNSKRPFLYHLSALILHYGHHDSGHFVAIRKVKYKTPNGIREAWFRVSDATVDRIHDIETDVFLHGSRFCYMLFYERGNKL